MCLSKDGSIQTYISAKDDFVHGFIHDNHDHHRIRSWVAKVLQSPPSQLQSEVVSMKWARTNPDGHGFLPSLSAHGSRVVHESFQPAHRE